MWQLCGADPEKRFTWDMANNDNLVFDGFQPRARYDRFVFPGCLVGGHGGWSRCGRCFHVFAVYQFAIARLGAQAVLPALQRQVRPFAGVSCMFLQGGLLTRITSSRQVTLRKSDDALFLDPLQIFPAKRQEEVGLFE